MKDIGSWVLGIGYRVLLYTWYLTPDISSHDPMPAPSPLPDLPLPKRGMPGAPDYLICRQWQNNVTAVSAAPSTMT